MSLERFSVWEPMPYMIGAAIGRITLMMAYSVKNKLMNIARSLLARCK